MVHRWGESHDRLKLRAYRCRVVVLDGRPLRELDELVGGDGGTCCDLRLDAVG